MEREKIEAGFRLVLEGLGADADHPDLRDTPRRTAQAWAEELCAGLSEAPVALDTMPLPEGGPAGLVVLEGIPVKSMCAHHLLPFTGEAVVGYLPGDSICGLSRLSRVVNHFARRPQMQEFLTQQVAEYLERELRPRGVGVVVRGRHLCMELRGVNHPGVMTTTTLLGGLPGRRGAARGVHGAGRLRGGGAIRRPAAGPGWWPSCSGP